MSQEALRQFESEMAGELEALTLDVARAGRAGLLPLDRSYASLDRIEDYSRLVLDRKKKAGRARAESCVARYVGGVVAEQADGRWRAGTARTEAFVVKLRAVPRVVHQPWLRVGEIENHRMPGLLRDRTERHDVRLQRRLIDGLTRDIPGTLARLRRDAQEQTGIDPGVLESTADLSRHEPAVAAVKSASASRELWRRLRASAAIAIGQLLQAQLGAAPWMVEENPRDIDLGVWTLFGVRLGHTVERVDPRTRPDGLRQRVEKMIASRKPEA